MRHNRCWDRIDAQIRPHEAGEQVQGMPVIFPEGAPGTIGNRVGKVRPVA
jgi:hypothetical protein